MNKKNNKLPIETKNEMFGLYLYQFANDIRKRQQDVFWTDEEIPVENDIQDYKVNMNKEQFGLVSSILQDFVEIEQDVGDIWEQIATWYPHSEIEGACSTISAMEKSVHAFFYQKMSDTLNIEPEVIAENQKSVLEIKEKLEYIKSIIKNLGQDKPLSLFTVAMIEQVLLFGNFAMLKSFKSNGYNYINNTLTGVDFVVNDEQLHGEFAKMLHITHITEYEKNIGKFNWEEHKKNAYQIAKEIVKYEDASINYKFSGSNKINDISKEDLKSFIRSRVNIVLEDMNMDPLYEIESNPIAEWFYKGSKSIKIHDFFNSGTNQYRRNWKTENFSRLPFLKGESDANK